MNHTYFYMGMAMLQVVYIAYQYILLRRREYLYYIFYTIIFSICIFFKACPELNPLKVFVIEGENFTACRGLLLVGLSMYLSFGRYFTETPTLYKKLNFQLLFVERVLLILGTIDIISQSFGMDYFAVEPISEAVYFSVMLFCIYVIIFLIRKKKVLTTILVLGSSCLLLFALLSLIDIIWISKSSSPVNNHLFLELGIISELLFLNYGLIYKTRIMQKENIQLEVSKQIELYNQRVAISSDLHDEVGTTLSGIALYSHLAAEQAISNEKDQLKNSLTIIQDNASEMVSRLSDIIWAVNPRHDSMESMLQHLEEYILKMATSKGIEVNFEISKDIILIKLPMAYRKNIYLVSKEIINNSVKYSSCTRITFKAMVNNNDLLFFVSDNGLGFNPDHVKTGNGIENMKQRAEQMGAFIRIVTNEKTGTQITLTCKIPQ